MHNLQQQEKFVGKRNVTDIGCYMQSRCLLFHFPALFTLFTYKCKEKVCRLPVGYSTVEGLGGAGCGDGRGLEGGEIGGVDS